MAITRGATRFAAPGGHRVDQELERALAAHHRGRLEEAERGYRALLRTRPRHAEAWHLLGVVAHQRGDAAAALSHIERALGLGLATPSLWSNLGLALAALGRLDDALDAYDRALALEPGFARAHDNRALALASLGRLDEALDGHARAIAADPQLADAHAHLGITLAAKGRLDEAREAYERALAVGPPSADTENNLSVTLRRQGRFVDAEAACRRALALTPRHPEALTNLGLALESQGRSDVAEQAYRAALAVDADNVEAHNSLGCMLARRGAAADAMGEFLAAIVLQPTHAAAHTNLGGALRDLGFYEEAEASHRRALELAPALAEAHNNLGLALRDQGRVAEAAQSYRAALAYRPDLAEARNNLGTAHFALGQFDEAAAHYEAALAQGLDTAEVNHNLASTLQSQGRVAEATVRYTRAQAIAFDPARALRMVTMLPVIPESAAAIVTARTRLVEGLAALAEARLTVPAFEVPVVNPSFYLAYQAMDDRPLQEAMSTLCRQACPSLSWRAPWLDGAPAPGGRLRVGIASRHLTNHTIGKFTRGFIEHLDRERFEVVAIDVSTARDDVNTAIMAAADHAVRVPLRLSDARARIAELRCDVLFYPDIGMDPFTYFLAYARLARAQVVTWGHPVTTGLSSLDWFVSADDLEPAGAEAHYTERLARLTRLPACYHAADTPDVPATAAECRRLLGLATDATLYLCPHSLFKIHPDTDAILGELLRRDPRAELVLLEGMSAHWSAALRARFARVFPDAVDRVRFLPRLSMSAFLALLRAADAVLDPLHWTGGNATYEAFALGVPVVTTPGAFMRGRVTAAASRQIGVADLVAPDPAAYVDIAHRLAHDPAWRADIGARLIAGHARLYDDVAAVRELEGVFAHAITTAGA